MNQCNALRHNLLQLSCSGGSRLDLHSGAEAIRAAKQRRQDRELRRGVFTGRADRGRQAAGARRTSGVPELRLDRFARPPSTIVRHLYGEGAGRRYRVQLPALQGVRVRSGHRRRRVLPRLAVGSRVPAAGSVRGEDVFRVPPLREDDQRRRRRGRAAHVREVPPAGGQRVLLLHLWRVAGSRIGLSAPGRSTKNRAPRAVVRRLRTGSPTSGRFTLSGTGLPARTTSA